MDCPASDPHAQARRRGRTVAVAMFLIGFAVHEFSTCSQDAAEERRAAPAMTAQRAEFFATLCAWSQTGEVTAGPIEALRSPRWLRGLCDGDPVANARACVHGAACAPAGR